MITGNTEIFKTRFRIGYIGTSIIILYYQKLEVYVYAAGVLYWNMRKLLKVVYILNLILNTSHMLICKVPLNIDKYKESLFWKQVSKKVLICISFIFCNILNVFSDIFFIKKSWNFNWFKYKSIKNNVVNKFKIGIYQ